MKNTEIDEDLMQVYNSEKLWKEDGYYYALLEQAIRQLDDLDPRWRMAISRWGMARQQLTLNRTYSEDGTVNISVTKEPTWRKLLRVVTGKTL